MTTKSGDIHLPKISGDQVNIKIFTTDWSEAMSDPPQNMIVAVQLLVGVRGIMVVPALAGYVRIASGMLSSGVSIPVL